MKLNRRLVPKAYSRRGPADCTKVPLFHGGCFIVATIMPPDPKNRAAKVRPMLIISLALPIGYDECPADFCNTPLLGSGGNRAGSSGSGDSQIPFMHSRSALLHARSVSPLHTTCELTCQRPCRILAGSIGINCIRSATLVKRGFVCFFANNDSTPCGRYPCHEVASSLPHRSR